MTEVTFQTNGNRMDYSMKSARTTNYSKGKKVKLDSSFIPAHK